MGETDEEPDPRRRIPTLLWLMLGVLVVVVFACAVVITGKGIHPMPAVGPPAGAPPSAGQT